MLRDFATILVRPRETMRRILDRGRDRAVVPLILLAFVVSILDSFDRKQIDLPELSMTGLVAIAALILIVVALLWIAFFYGLSYVAMWLGRVFEGTGTPREVRSALAWGLAPLGWSLLYHLPMLLYRSGSGTPPGRFTLDLRASSLGCAGIVLALFIQVGFFVWYVVIASNTLAEAHRFSAWRGAATLLLSFASPVIVIVAAILTAAT